MPSGNVFEVKLDAVLPPDPVFEPQFRRAPHRGMTLSAHEMKQALMNALRYIPTELHSRLAPEFLRELKEHGRIYGYRYRPAGRIWGRPIDAYKGTVAGRAMQVMIDNNLDFDIALYPYELVTYGETGQVFQNWMQYRLIMKYLEAITDEQTLVVQSGHPLGLFPSRKEAPRVISTNGLVIGKWDNPEDFQRLTALGVANYGQMTAGGWMYIGPQGIVHGTFITLLNAGRKYLGIPRRPRSGRGALHFLRPGRHERRSVQSRGDRRRYRSDRGSGPQPHRDQTPAGLGGPCIELSGRNLRLGG